MYDNFCGDSDSSGFIFKHSGFNFLLLRQPTSCINQASILCFYFVLLVLLLVNLIQKSLSTADKTPSWTRGFSKLQIVIKSCAGLSSLKTRKQIHCVALVSGFDSDSFVLSSLVHMYVQCNRLWEARNVFDRLPQPDVVTCSALLSGHARNGHVKEAKELLNIIKHLGLGLNSVTWNGMIAGFNHSRHYLDAVVVFWDMHLEGFVLDEAGISSVLPGVGDLEMLDMGIQIHCYVMKKGFEQDKCVVSALIDMYGKCGSTMEMSKVFDEMDENDIGSCNALVTGLARNGCVDNSLELFDKFKRQRMDLNVVFWTPIIVSCSRNGKDIEALELFKEMQVEGVKPNSRTIPSLLPACGNIAALMHGKAAHCFSLKKGISYDVHWMFLLLWFTNCVEHLEQQVTPLILVDSKASYMLQPMLILVKLKLPPATFLMKQWLIPWVWRYSLAFNLEDKVVLKGGVML